MCLADTLTNIHCALLDLVLERLFLKRDRRLKGVVHPLFAGVALSASPAEASCLC